jgi:hypothetical protein
MTGREEAAGRWDEQPVVAHGTVVVATARRQLRPDSLGRNVVYRRSARPIAALGIVFCGLRISLPTRPRWEYPEYAHIAETSAVKIALISPEPGEALGPNRALPPENEGFAVRVGLIRLHDPPTRSFKYWLVRTFTRRGSSPSSFISRTARCEAA